MFTCRKKPTHYINPKLQKSILVFSRLCMLQKNWLRGIIKYTKPSETYLEMKSTLLLIKCLRNITKVAPNGLINFFNKKLYQFSYSERAI